MTLHCHEYVNQQNNPSMFLADTKDLVKSTNIVGQIQQKHHISDISAQDSKLKILAKTEKKRRNLLNISSNCVDGRGGTVHVFIPNRHDTDLSVRCMRPYNEYRQFTPNPEGGARSNATLFDNRVDYQTALNNEEQRMPWVVHLKTKPPRQWPCADSERVSHIDWQRSIL